MNSIKFLLGFLILSCFLFSAEQNITSEEILRKLDIDYKLYQAKAYEAYQKQDYETAIQNYLICLSSDISDNNSLYNLACCYGLTGDKEKAVKFLLAAFENGFDNLEHIKQDADFEKIRDTKIFQNAIKEMEEKLSVNDLDADTTYFKSMRLEKALISLPETFDPERNYTLIVGLHGYGGNAKNFMRLMKSCKRDSLILITPFAPYPFSLGKKLGYSWSLWSEDEDVGKDSHQCSQLLILEVIEMMKEEYPIKDVYLFGFSQGAFMSFDMAMHYYEKIDGIIPFGGGVWGEIDVEAMENVKNIRLFVAHGKNDRIVEFELSQKAVDAFKDQGLEVKFIDFDGAHQVPRPILQKAFNWSLGR